VSGTFVLAGGVVVDGTGAPRIQADVAVRDGRIVAVGEAARDESGPRIDMGGLVVAPGFIDVHTHDDAVLLQQPDMPMKVSQGVTSVVCGNCGASAAPYDSPHPFGSLMRLIFKSEDQVSPRMGTYIDRVNAAAPAVNAVFLVGHATLRMAVMGEDLNRAARPDEIAAMQAMLAQALDDGAIGLSTGLFYPPAKKATTGEVIEIGRPLTAARALYATHMRDEEDGILDSIDEALRIGRTLDIRTIISHVKCVGLRNFGRSVEALAKLGAAAEQQPLGFDVYPYTAGATILLEENVQGCQRVMITWSEPHPEATGRDLDDIARDWDCDIFEATRRLQPGGAIYFKMDEADVRRILSHPNAMIGSDGLAADAHPHPRLWGTFPRVLGRYVRDEGLFPLEDAIRRMTSLPAANFGLHDRGRIAAGLAADIVVLDPASVIDTATFDKPRQAARGIVSVHVAGQPVWQDGRTTGNGPGRAWRRQELP
jgi:N-acyl-D-amino-acid deacylase